MTSVPTKFPTICVLPSATIPCWTAPTTTTLRASGVVPPIVAFGALGDRDAFGARDDGISRRIRSDQISHHERIGGAGQIDPRGRGRRYQVRGDEHSRRVL